MLPVLGREVGAYASISPPVVDLEGATLSRLVGLTVDAHAGPESLSDVAIGVGVYRDYRRFRALGGDLGTTLSTRCSNELPYFLNNKKSAPLGGASLIELTAPARGRQVSDLIIRRWGAL